MSKMFPLPEPWVPKHVVREQRIVNEDFDLTVRLHFGCPEEGCDDQQQG